MTMQETISDNFYSPSPPRSILKARSSLKLKLGELGLRNSKVGFHSIPEKKKAFNSVRRSTETFQAAISRVSVLANERQAGSPISFSSDKFEICAEPITLRKSKSQRGAAVTKASHCPIAFTAT